MTYFLVSGLFMGNSFSFWNSEIVHFLLCFGHMTRFFIHYTSCLCSHIQMSFDRFLCAINCFSWLSSTVRLPSTAGILSTAGLSSTTWGSTDSEPRSWLTSIVFPMNSGPNPNYADKWIRNGSSWVRQKSEFRSAVKKGAGSVTWRAGSVKTYGHSLKILI